jgi:hypothetical protein
VTTIAELQKIAQARLDDAASLVQCGRAEGAIYLCGYAVEVGLKCRICKTLKWEGFPAKNADFKDYQSFKTHNLDVLLHLSGLEQQTKVAYLPEWSIVRQWDPESRYNPIGKVNIVDAAAMISAARTLLTNI